MLDSILVQDAHGKELCRTSVVDITERKRMEEALRKSEERLRLTLEAINDGVWDWNIPTGTAVFSPRWYTMLGYEAYESLQNYDSWRSLVHPEDIVRIEREINKHIASGEGYAIEIRMRTKSDGWRWILTRGMVVERDADGRPIRMVGTHSDITEHKRSEEALRESEERYRMIFNHAPLGVMHFDSDGIIRDFNNKFAEIMGAHREKILGFNMIERLDDPAMLEAVKDALDGQLGYYEGSYFSVTGRKATPMRAFYQRIAADDGTFLGAWGSLRTSPSASGQRRLSGKAKLPIGLWQRTCQELSTGFFQMREGCCSSTICSRA